MVSLVTRNKPFLAKFIFPFTDKMFYFTCFNVDDPDDPTVGLVNGELAIPGNLLRREVFDPVVNQASDCSLMSFIMHSMLLRLEDSS